METNRSVALVGRPNVGKSRLFNRLARRRVAIVHDEPGVTRDVISAVVDDDYTLMDTGGIGMELGNTPKILTEATRLQVAFAVDVAALILFVVDAREGLMPQDEIIAAQLRKSGKRVVLVANKAEPDAESQNVSHEFLRLGFGAPLEASAEHNRGIGELREAIAAVLGPKPEAAPAADAAPRVRICLVGKPNVGKSSIGNRLLKSDRLIVSEIPGTTPLKDGGLWRFELIDTAGLRASTKLSTSVEYFSSVRTREAVEESDVAILVLDALGGVTKQDKRVAGEIVNAGKGLVVVVNKWDLAMKKFAGEALQGYTDIDDFKRKFLDAVLAELFFLPRCPVVFASAMENLNLGELLRTAHEVYENYARVLSTAKVNRAVREIVDKRPPAFVSGARFKVYYALQVSHAPQTIRLYCNRPLRLDEEYARYLERAFQDAFRLYGVPIRFRLVGKTAPQRPLFEAEETRGARARGGETQRGRPPAKRRRS